MVRNSIPFGRAGPGYIATQAAAAPDIELVNVTLDDGREIGCGASGFVVSGPYRVQVLIKNIGSVQTYAYAVAEVGGQTYYGSATSIDPAGPGNQHFGVSNLYIQQRGATHVYAVTTEAKRSNACDFSTLASIPAVPDVISITQGAGSTVSVLVQNRVNVDGQFRIVVIKEGSVVATSNGTSVSGNGQTTFTFNLGYGTYAFQPESLVSGAWVAYPAKVGFVSVAGTGGTIGALPLPSSSPPPVNCPGSPGCYGYIGNPSPGGVGAPPPPPPSPDNLPIYLTVGLIGIAGIALVAILISQNQLV